MPSLKPFFPSAFQKLFEKVKNSKGFWGKKKIFPLLFFVGLALFLSLFFSISSLKKEMEEINTLALGSFQKLQSLQDMYLEECQRGNTMRGFLSLPLSSCVLPGNSAEEKSTESPEEALSFYLKLLKRNSEKDIFEKELFAFVDSYNLRIKEEKPPRFLKLSEGANTSLEELSSDIFEEGVFRGSLSFFPLEKKWKLESTEGNFQEFSDTVSLFSALEGLLKTPPLPPQEEEKGGEENHFEEGAEIVPSFEKGKKIQEFLSSPDFQKYLTSLGFVLKSEVKENGDITAYIFQGETLLRELSFRGDGSEALAKNMQNGSITSLFGLRELFLKKEQASSFDIQALQGVKAPSSLKGRENYLLLGHNGGNIDTIILAHVFHTKKKVFLISIPRDLLINGEKINSLYAKYGMNAFLEKVEEITGQKVSGFVLIDFELFRSAIDAIGGVTITLASDLIDPTYKTIDNGVEGTLSYEKGSHHISGTEALRLSRSRATSSDFERAKRQHQILQAAKEKLVSLSAKDADIVLRLATRLFQNITRTDLSPQKMVPLFFSAKDYEVKGGIVISSQNVLTSEKRDIGNGGESYVLVPQNDDYSLISAFIWKIVL